jgi:hypothetical protein
MIALRLRVAALACAVVALVALPTAARAEPKLAVLGLEVVDQGSGSIDGKSSAFAKALTKELRAQAGRSKQVELAAGANKDLLELKLLSDCSDEGRRCMAQIGKELGADLLLYGKVEKQQDGFQVSLKLLETASAKMNKTTSDLVPYGEAKGAGVVSWAGTLYARLTGAPELGALAIKVNNAETGKVFVDGEQAGELEGSTARITGLTEGVHRITILSDGKARYDQEVTITSGRDEKLNVSLEVEESIAAVGEDEIEGDAGGGRGGWRKAFWITTGVTVVGTGLWLYEAHQYSGIGGLTGKGPLKERQLDAAADARMLLPADDERFGAESDACADAAALDDEDSALGTAAARVTRACDKGKRAAKLTMFMGLATGLSAVAAAYFYYRGYVGAEAAASERHGSRRRTPRAPTVTLTPAIGPTSVGAGLAIEF